MNCVFLGVNSAVHLCNAAEQVFVEAGFSDGTVQGGTPTMFTGTLLALDA